MARKSTHGESFRGKISPEYEAWRAMKARCLNPNGKTYARYGGRGIKIYQPWVDDFSQFLEYVGRKPTPEHSLDRIDVDGNYEPGNVKWSTTTEQNRNKRNTHHITYNGETLTLPEWTEKLNFPRDRLRIRLASGYTVEEAFEIPIGRQYRRKRNANR